VRHNSSGDAAGFSSSEAQVPATRHFPGLPVCASVRPHSNSYYDEAWRDYRRRLAAPFVLFLAFVASPYPAYLLLRVGIPAVIPMLAIGALIVAIAVAWVRLWMFPCPRCGELFRKVSGWYGKTCAHCGLQKGGYE
jgi:hypothetical protein